MEYCRVRDITASAVLVALRCPGELPSLGQSALHDIGPMQFNKQAVVYLTTMAQECVC
jgi:hypothetical protein